MDLQALKDKAATSKESTESEASTEKLTKLEAESEKKYQHYTSSRISTRMITPENLRINFVNFKYITDDPRIISYLDNEIACGLNTISKGELLTHREADPMETYKQKVIEEYLAEQAETAKLAPAPLPDMGSTKTPAEQAKAINPATSEDVAN